MGRTKKTHKNKNNKEVKDINLDGLLIIRHERYTNFGIIVSPFEEENYLNNSQ